jgi:hypothetical protein
MFKTIQRDTQNVSDDWLAVSTEGFASMNAGRDPAHLVKELVQNALDALDEGGQVELTSQPGSSRRATLITCRDNGCGMDDLAEIRTVFHTTKIDSHLKRGRMGRGFKEMLCLANWATVTSGSRAIRFIKENGKRITREEAASEAISGTLVQMEMPWAHKVIPKLVEYFATFLLPRNVRFVVNDRTIERRESAHVIDATLPTELLDEGKWIRPSRKTSVELVPIQPEQEPLVYELGIPVCPVEWTQPFHANVLQRVPMNPGRDAVASGYLLRLHKSCLPTLLPEMNGEQVLQDWVGQAVPHCDRAVQQQIIRVGFGENIARSVPKMGVRQFDEDARDIGVGVIDTKQTSGGFRQILQQHVPTTREVVHRYRQELVGAAVSGGFDPADVFGSHDSVSRERRKLIDAAGGRERVERVMDFARWFCQKLMDGYSDAPICSVTLALLRSVNAIATWSDRDILTLGIDTAWLWTDPLGEETLATLIHETAHHLNAHHGRDFHKELEILAGRAARLMFLEAEFIRRQYEALL